MIEVVAVVVHEAVVGVVVEVVCMVEAVVLFVV